MVMRNHGFLDHHSKVLQLGGGLDRQFRLAKETGGNLVNFSSFRASRACLRVGEPTNLAEGGLGQKE